MNIDYLRDVANAKLPDLLAPNLKLVFVGTAAGAYSAAQKAYYAKPGNKFWPTLQAVGLTPDIMAPEKFRDLLLLRIGLTDICKISSGMDRQIPKKDFDVSALKKKLQFYAPRLVAFTSKNAGSIFHGVKSSALAYGLQPSVPGLSDTFVLPSPSGLANSHWSLEPWRRLAALVAMQDA